MQKSNHLFIHVLYICSFALSSFKSFQKFKIFNQLSIIKLTVRRDHAVENIFSTLLHLTLLLTAIYEINFVCICNSDDNTRIWYLGGDLKMVSGCKPVF